MVFLYFSSYCKTVIFCPSSTLHCISLSRQYCTLYFLSPKPWPKTLVKNLAKHLVNDLPNNFRNCKTLEPKGAISFRTSSPCSFHPHRNREIVLVALVQPAKLYYPSVVKNLAKNLTKQLTKHLVKNLAKNLGAGGGTFSSGTGTVGWCLPHNFLLTENRKSMLQSKPKF